MAKKQITKSIGYISFVILISINVISCNKIDNDLNEEIKNKENLNMFSIDESENIKEKPKKSKVESNNLEQLIKERNLKLQISEDKLSYNLATEEFSNRIIELLSDFHLVKDSNEADNAKSENYIILNFLGYDKILR